MAFEQVNFTHKRVRTQGSREWKLWYSESDGGLAFRCLTKDSASDCYVTISGLATQLEGDLPVQESDGDEAFFTEHYRYHGEEGSIDIYLETEDGDLAWVHGMGDSQAEGCAFDATGPLMPEIAG